MKTIILVRHGESETNIRKVFTGQLNVQLTPAGREQARLMAEYLDKYKIDKLYVSSLQRAVDTAEPIRQRQNCPMEKCDELMEINSGFWQGLTFEQIAEKAEFSVPRTYNTGYISCADIAAAFFSDIVSFEFADDEYDYSENNDVGINLRHNFAKN